MFLRNAWYIGALTQEVTRLAPFSRRILGEPVVFLRARSGEVAALHDRCPHRFAPLSLGRIRNDEIHCGYHGMAFDKTGRCVLNPTQPAETIPDNVRVKTYPLVERHGLLWIWMGEPSAADPDKIPNYWQYHHSEWAAATAHMRVEANYLLLIDNLIDLTHIAFVHPDILGNAQAASQSSASTDISDRGIVERRRSLDAPAVPAWKAAFDDYEGNVDLWMDMYWEAGSNLILDVGVTPTSRPREEGVGIWQLDCLTPETATSTHYFYGVAHRYRIDEPAITSFWMQALDYAFNQDRRIVEAVQKNMNGQWDILTMSPAVNKADRAALQARRILRRMMKEESGPPLETVAPCSA
jgi:vanillate O-demethylase monooxygenase subunit